MLLAVSGALFLAPLVAEYGLPVAAALAIFLLMVAASFIVTYIVKALDPDSTISLRRMFGLALASNLVWAVPLYVGSLVSIIQGNHRPGLDEFVVGAFLAWSLDLLVINGAFIPSTAKSLCISALQPLPTLLLASAFILELRTSTLYALALGFVILAITAGFLLRFKAFKTRDLGINSLQILQSFLKTWVSQKPADLESYFTRYARDEPVTTRVVLLSDGARAALVLPGVHPGPFYPVGSYNVSELIFHELRRNGVTPMVLHGVGGHERNLPTNELAMRYASAIAGAVESSGGGPLVKKIRGPSKLQLGTTSLTTLGFGDQVMTFLSNAPRNTDDLEPATIDQAVSAASEAGIELMLIDSHNSIGGENPDQSDIDWSRVFSDLDSSPEEEFELGLAHSSELPQFEHGSDISDGGIGALVLRKHNSTYALIASDSNNAVLGLRQRVIDELKKQGVDLIELCTSDTHSFAARYLTDRGYHALGEDTDREVLVGTIKELEKLAEGRLSPGKVTAITSRLTLPLIGDKSLNDFAELTRDALSFAKQYAGAALLSIAVICALGLLL